MNEKLPLNIKKELGAKNQEQQGDVERYKVKLSELACALLNDAGQKRVQELLDDDRVYEVRKNLLLALDDMVLKGYIEFQTAGEKYKLLGFSKIEASKIRNKDEHNIE